jgi:signal peptidase I
MSAIHILSIGRRLRRGRRRALPGVVSTSGRVVAETLLTALALLGVAIAGLTAYAVTHDFRTVIVRSGSMAPTMPTGSLLLTRSTSADLVEVGDVVSVMASSRRVTHRVIGKQRQGDTTLLTLKGDANEDPDAEPYAVRAVDRVVWHIPRLGRVGSYLATGPGGFVLGATTASAVVCCIRLRVASRRQRHHGR